LTLYSVGFNAICIAIGLSHMVKESALYEA